TARPRGCTSGRGPRADASRRRARSARTSPRPRGRDPRRSASGTPRGPSVASGRGEPRPGEGALSRGADEIAEQRCGPRRARLELRVELARDEPGVVGQLDDLDEASLLERPRHDEPRLDEPRPEMVVHLVTVA